MGTYQTDRAWADRYNEPLANIIRSQAHNIIDVRLATDDEDRACDADIVMTVSGGNILCRVRDTNYRDLTIRSWRSSGASTEKAKILAGAGKWYLYGWVSSFGAEIAEWMFIDLDILRKTGLIERAPEKSNPDGRTKFIYISRSTLRESGVIVAEQAHDQRNQAHDTLTTIAGQKPRHINWDARRLRAAEWIRTHKTLAGYPYQREPE